MTNWYQAVCDEHREVCTIFVTTNHGRPHPISPPYPQDAWEAATQFLSDHWTCKLRLIRDHETDEYPKDYVDKTPP